MRIPKFAGRIERNCTSYSNTKVATTLISDQEKQPTHSPIRRRLGAMVLFSRFVAAFAGGPLLLSFLVVVVVVDGTTNPLAASTSKSGQNIPWGLLAGGAVQMLAKQQQDKDELVAKDDAAQPLSQFSKMDKDREAPLLDDIELLSQILGELVHNEDPETFNVFKEFRQYGLDRAEDVNNQVPLQRMIEHAAKLTADQAVGVTRSFSIMLNLVNSAEVYHRQRVTRQHAKNQTAALLASVFKDNDHASVGAAAVGPLPLSQDSMRGTMKELLTTGQVTPEQIYQQLRQQKVEIVLTAHPTQVQRKSLLRKYRRISEMLALRERPDLDLFEKQEAIGHIRRIVSSIWGADEIRRNKPTPQQEAAGGNAIIESVLWDAVPSYLRKLHTQCQLQLGLKLPVDVAPIRFASWIGGDRDGT